MKTPRPCLALCWLLASLTFCGCAAGPTMQAKLLRLARDADAAYQAGEYAASKKKYELLLEQKPTYATANVRLGAIAYREGDAVDARMQFEIAIRKDPKNAQAQYNLAMLSLNDAVMHLEQYATLGQQPRRERAIDLLRSLREFQEN